MSRIRSRWTRPEVLFQLRHPSATRGDFLPFRPDFLLRGTPVFVDGAFWHCDLPRRRFDRLAEFWSSKLIRNYCRDLSRDSFYPRALIYEARQNVVRRVC